MSSIAISTFNYFLLNSDQSFRIVNVQVKLHFIPTLPATTCGVSSSSYSYAS
jgi:hypothetical protein